MQWITKNVLKDKKSINCGRSFTHAPQKYQRKARCRYANIQLIESVMQMSECHNLFFIKFITPTHYWINKEIPQIKCHKIWQNIQEILTLAPPRQSSLHSILRIYNVGPAAPNYARRKTQKQLNAFIFYIISHYVVFFSYLSLFLSVFAPPWVLSNYLFDLSRWASEW